MILRICVVIPTYNNALSINEVVNDVLANTKFPLMVIDDGSDTPLETLLPKHDRLQIIRHKKNCGKGVALQTAFKEAVKQNFTHVLAMDGDGQHLVTELEKLITVGKTNPWSMVIGARKMNSITVPNVSKFGRAFSNFWVKFQTGTPVSDSQSGLRLYPLFHLQNLKFFCKRYDFEIEVLIRLMWKGVEILEADVDVFYPEKDKRVSHFDKLWDNVRISTLNTLLVVLSLLKTNRSPAHIGLATGIGAFIGCSPFFGIHIFIVAAVAFLFRLNAFWMWMGSNISTPIVAPLIIAASIAVGHEVVPGEGTWPTWLELKTWSFTQLLEFAGTHFMAWFVGSAILGIFLGIFVGGLTGIASHHMQKKVSKSTWNGRSRGGALGNGFIKLVLRYLGIQAGYFCLLFIIPYFYLFAPKGRRALSEYWKNVRPDEGFFTRQWQILKHFYKYGQILMDSAVQRLSPKSHFSIHSTGTENIRTVVDQKKGVFLLSGHAGAWTVASSMLNFKLSVFVVAYRAETNTFPSVFEIQEALKKGQTVCVMVDRPMGTRFELVSFFGKLAPFDTTPFRLAAATGAPLLFSFGFKGEGFVYEFYANPAKIYVQDKNIDSRLQAQQWIQEFANAFEEYLKKYPHQWFNFYPFWSSLPTVPGGEKSLTGQNCLLEELRTPPPTTPESAFAR